MAGMSGRIFVQRLLGFFAESPEDSAGTGGDRAGLGLGDGAGLDWQVLRREGLLGLTVDQLLQARQEIPQDVSQLFKQAVVFEMRCGGILCELSRLAAERGIEVLTFKGCALAFGLYPRRGQRTFCDIDLAVRPSDHSGMVELLKSLGYHFDDTGHRFTRQGLTLDLHDHPLHQLSDLVGPQSQTWWNYLRPLSERTGLTRRLAHEHEFVLGLFHGAKHSFSRAGWIVDLALLAARLEEETLLRVITDYRLQRHLLCANACLREWFELELPGFPARLLRALPNALERKFLQLVIQRKAPEFLGMLTPLSAAKNVTAAWRYLRSSLYPAGVSPWERTLQLWRMALAVARA